MRTLAAAALLALSACATPLPPGSADFTQYQWALTHIGSARVTLPPSVPTFRIEGERINGYGGCNSFFGTAVVRGEGARFTGIGSTRRACVPERMQTEHAYLQTLQQVVRAHLEGESGPLVMYDANGAELLRFSLAIQVPAPPG